MEAVGASQREMAPCIAINMVLCGVLLVLVSACMHDWVLVRACMHDWVLVSACTHMTTLHLSTFSSHYSVQRMWCCCSMHPQNSGRRLLSLG